MTEKELQAAREAKNEYMREWRKANKEKHNGYIRKWRSKNKEKIAEINRRYWKRKADAKKKQSESN